MHQLDPWIRNTAVKLIQKKKVDRNECVSHQIVQCHTKSGQHAIGERTNCNLLMSKQHLAITKVLNLQNASTSKGGIHPKIFELGI